MVFAYYECMRVGANFIHGTGWRELGKQRFTDILTKYENLMISRLQYKKKKRRQSVHLPL